MSEPHDRFENAPPPDGWIVERRPCPMCCVKACGCPDEPDMRLIPSNIILGGDGD